MKILSLDQSLATTGYALAFNGEVEKIGIIKTTAEKKKRNIGDMDDKSRRTRFIIEQLQRIIQESEVRAIVCEEYAGFSQSKTAADALATSRTVVVAVSHFFNIPMAFVPACDAKHALTGNMNASKTQMIQAAAAKYPDRFEVYKSTRSRTGFLGTAEHVADAIGIYLAARKLQTIKFVESFGVQAPVTQGELF